MDFDHQSLTTDQAPLANPVTSASFTTGPWEVETFGDYSSIYTKSAPANGGDIICNSPDPVEERSSFEHWQANARLIASAPDLLAALELTRATLQGIKGMAETESRNGSDAWGRAVGMLKEQIATNRAALAKARGQ
jgi:hypothetical protein